MKRKSLQAALLAAVMGVVSMPHAVLAADAPSEAAAAVNTWIGYQLRDDAGQYLTVANGQRKQAAGFFYMQQMVLQRIIFGTLQKRGRALIP